MNSHSFKDGHKSNSSSPNRFSFESSQNNSTSYNLNDESQPSNFNSFPKTISGDTSECHSVSAEEPNLDDVASDSERTTRDLLTTSVDIPEFDPELLRGDYMSQNLFENDATENVEQRDECEIVNIVPRNSITSSALSQINSVNDQNGSTLNPIFVEDSANSQNQTGVPQPGTTDDCIMGPIRWINKRPPQFPLDYYMSNKRISNAYRFIDNDDSWDSKTLEDIEFLFKCPICYSTITRLRSGKVPNENDKVIYSTKCGHLFCYECIESVKSRKECSICRKPLRDKNQFHVVFP